jgi:hypothetical protein
LTVSGEPNLYFPDANTLDRINGGSLSLTVTLDGSGNATSGTMTINGTTDAGLADPLLTADVDAIGLEDSSPNPGGTDRIDLRMTPTGGSIFEGPDWPAGFDLTATGTLLNSDYAGSVASNWTCGDANLVLGAEFFGSPMPPPTEVAIDVRPGCLNINGNGVIPIAIYGSDILDVAEIDRETLTFQGLEVNRRGGKNDEPQCSNGDFNGDGNTDLICQFDDDLDKWIPPENDIGELLGLLQDGVTMISGSEELCLVGKKSINIPNVVGSNQEVAEMQLSADGLSVGSVNYEANAAVAAGMVIEQSPAACSDCAAPGDPVKLFVSAILAVEVRWICFSWRDCFFSRQFAPFTYRVIASADRGRRWPIPDVQDPGISF